MTKSKSTIALVWFIAGAGTAFAQSNDIATGNMHMDVKAMDTNGDHMISRAEFSAYGEKMWRIMSKGKATVPVHDAAQDFATGNMPFSAEEMDTDHDGSVSKAEFMTYGGKQFDKVKDPKGMLTVEDDTKYFSTGNMNPDGTPKKP